MSVIRSSSIHTQHIQGANTGRLKSNLERPIIPCQSNWEYTGNSTSLTNGIIGLGLSDKSLCFLACISKKK